MEQPGHLRGKANASDDGMLREEVLAEALQEHEYPVHALFAQAYHRIHRYFRDDQSWRETDSPDEQSFQSLVSDEGDETGYKKLLTNVQGMLKHLAKDAM